MQNRWYKSSLDIVTLMLLPLSWLFQSLVSIRRFFYRSKIKKSYHFDVPVIVVGNITVGGTGKTPFVIWLAHFLKAQGFRPGIVSRGVGGRQQYEPRWVEKHSDPKEVGDEAVLLAKRCDCPMVIGVDRVAAVKALLAQTDCNIVMSDDGLQHYKLGRAIEIVMLDGDRGLGNKKFLPAGPLRESPARLKEVDFIIQQNQPGSDAHDNKAFAMQLRGDKFVSLKNEIEVSFNHFQKTPVHAVAAIGNPKRFFTLLRHYGLNIIEHEFPDHHLYQAEDFQFADSFPILMTEKDAVKCGAWADERYWYLPVEAHIDNQLGELLLTRLRRFQSHFI